MVEGEVVTFTEVQSLLEEKAAVLDALGFPITNISLSKSCDLHVSMRIIGRANCIPSSHLHSPLSLPPSLPPSHVSSCLLWSW